MDLKRRKTKLMHDAAWLPRLTSLSRELAPLTHPQSVSQQLCRDQHNPKRQPSSSQPGMFDHEVSATEERATSSASEPQRGSLSIKPNHKRGDNDTMRHVRFENKMAGQAGAGDRWQALRTSKETHGHAESTMPDPHTPCTWQHITRQRRMERLDLSIRKEGGEERS